MGLFAGTSLEPKCPDCGQPVSRCTCPAETRAARLRLPPEKQTARLTVEKRRKGKLATVVRGLTAEANDLPSLLARLKQALGTGGTLEGDELELQGDQLERARAALTALGYQVRQ
jgi:translation initiation factor 1